MVHEKRNYKVQQGSEYVLRNYKIIIYQGKGQEEGFVSQVTFGSEWNVLIPLP